jgi:hypothetical protein
MYGYIDSGSNSKRVNSFKKALYNLDCLQIAGVDCNYILDCGFVKSPTENILDYGSLGYIQCWELRPIKPTLYNLVNLSTRLGVPQKRRTKLIDLYTIDYNEDKETRLKKTRPRDRIEYRWNWSEIVGDYLLARQAHRDSLSGAVIGPLSAYYPEDIDLINIVLVASIYSPEWTRQVKSKRRRIDFAGIYI